MDLKSSVSFLEKLITHPQTPDAIMQDAFMVLGVMASSDIQPALQAIINLLNFPQTPYILDRAARRLLGAKNSEKIYPVIHVIEGLVTSPHSSDEVKQKAHEVLEKMAYLCVYPAIQALERLIPIFENFICNPSASEKWKQFSLAKLVFLTQVGRLASQVVERLLPALEKLITDSQTSDGVKDVAIQVLLNLFVHNDDQQATQALVRLIPVLGSFITDAQTSEGLKQTALSVIRALANQDIQSVFSSPELDKFLPDVEKLIYSEYSDELREFAFGTTFALSRRNQSAHQVIERFVSIFEDLVVHPDVYEGKLKYRLLKVFGIEDDIFHGGILALKKMSLKNVHPAIQASSRIIPVLEHLVTDPQTPDFLKYDCIELLGTVATKDIPDAVSVIQKIFSDLEHLITDSSLSHKIRQKAIVAASAGLPLQIKGPQLELPKDNYPSLSIDELLKDANYPCNPRFITRSLVYDLKDNDILVIKLLREGQDPSTLLREAYWIRYLNRLKKQGHFRNIRFDLPELMHFSNSFIIKLKDIPIEVPKEVVLHSEKYALCFTVHRDYFSYPNQTLPERILSGEDLKEVMARCAYLFGYLTSLGIIHTAPIPLFHNRFQIYRRPDRGMYWWWYGGYVERWLTSCDFPNMGKTGIRDFEHFISWGEDQSPLGYQDRQGLYHLVGTHLLSLLLVLGSYFRNKDRKRVGFDSEGNFIDARDLFNQTLFKEVIQAIFLEYYRGFVGDKYRALLPFDLDTLTQRMVARMGHDINMGQIWRRKDQIYVSDREAKELLLNSGYSEKEREDFEKGKRDMVVLNGPHLDLSEEGFPEIIDSIKIGAALCIMDRYKKEHNY